MPFLAPIFTAISGVVASVSAWAAASPILAGIAQTAFGIALKYAVNALFPPKTQSRASELEVQYGVNIPRSVILGTCAIEGHHVYRNNYGSGGRLIQDVFVLSSFRITAVPRVRYNGKWRELVSQDADGFWLVPNEGTSNDDHDNVKVKFYYGTMGQQGDPTLIAHSRPAGRWTAAHRGAGVAYAIVWSELRKNGDGLTSPAKLLFEVKGAPLYDWRKDSSVGGSGSHRWDNQDTWEYSDNPAVILYNLERGFFNGTQRMVGKAVRASRLPLAEYSQAANICDEQMSDGSKRYRAHAIAKDGAGANHDANITPILEAMCGSWVERVDGEFPIAGAPQAIVATITDDDIAVAAPLRFSAKRRRVELINTVAASYISPDDFYEAKDAATRIDAGALAEDRETLASSIPYGAVTDVRQVDRLADIAIRGARYQASAEIVVHPRFLDKIKEGRWIRWNSKKYGDRTYQVLTRTLGGLNTDGVRNISLALQEISNGVFDPTAYETTPPNIIVIPAPQYLAEVQGFDVLPTIVKADGQGEIAGARLLWDQIDDISVIGVDIEYWPANDVSQVFRDYATSDTTNKLITEGLTSLTDWFGRTRLRVDNGRRVAWSAPKSFKTLDAQSDLPPIDYDDLADGLQSMVDYSNEDIRGLWGFVKNLQVNVANMQFDRYSDLQSHTINLESSFGEATAKLTEQWVVATNDIDALASITTNLSAGLGKTQSELSQLSLTTASQYESLVLVTNDLNAQLGGKASTSAVDNLVSRVTETEGDIDALSLKSTELEAQLGDKASTSAVDALTTQVVQDGEDISAITNALTQVNASFDGGVSSGALRITASAGTGGIKTRLAMFLRASLQDQYRETGMFWNVTPTGAEMMFLADKFVFWNRTADTLIRPFVLQDGVLIGTGLIMDWANIRNVNIQWAQMETAVIENAIFGTTNIDFGAVTKSYQNAYDNDNVKNNGVYCRTTTQNPQGSTALVYIEADVMGKNTYGSAWLTVELINETTGEVFARNRKGYAQASGDCSAMGMYLDINSSVGVNVYGIRITVEGNFLSADVKLKVRSLVWQR